MFDKERTEELWILESARPVEIKKRKSFRTFKGMHTKRNKNIAVL